LEQIEANILLSR